MINKETWTKHRNHGTIDLEHLHFGLNLNKSVNLEINKLKELFETIRANVPFALKHLVDECKMRLDKHFNIVTITKFNKEIKTLK